MRLAISAITGYNTRELLLPLKEYLESNPRITGVTVFTPAHAFRREIFPDYSDKFRFVSEDTDPKGHQLVITTTAGLEPKEIPILRAAKNRGIPTLTFIASWDNVFKMERRRNLAKYKGAYELADHFAVWNQLNRDHLLRAFPEIRSEQITITGAPRFDFFSHADRIPARAVLFNKLGFSSDTQKLIHLSTTELYPVDYIAQSLAQASKTGVTPIPYHLLATVHPGGKLANHTPLETYGAKIKYSFGRRESSPHPDFIYNPTLADIYASIGLFKHANILINHSSTTTVESLVCDVPVINIHYGRRFDWWRWHRSMVYRDFTQHYRYITDEHATQVVENPKQLIQAVNLYLEQPEAHRQERKAAAQKLLTYTDGTAGRRLIDLIEHLAANV